MDTERFSACTYAVREKPLDYTFDLLARSGFRKVDLWGGLPHFSTDPAQCDHAALASTAKRHGLRLANLGTYPGRRFSSPDLAERDAELAEMKRTIDLAARLGARSIRVCPGTGEDPAIAAGLVPWFRASAEYAAAHGIYLGMENHKGSLAGLPEVCAELARRVASPYFGVLFEPANLMHAKVDYKKAYDLFRGFVTHVHVKDSRWVGDRYERTMLGEGQVDVRWLLRTLAADGYAGDFALEYEIEKVVPIEDGLPRWFQYAAAL